MNFLYTGFSEVRFQLAKVSKKVARLLEFIRDSSARALLKARVHWGERPLTKED